MKTTHFFEALVSFTQKTTFGDKKLIVKTLLNFDNGFYAVRWFSSKPVEGLENVVLAANKRDLVIQLRDRLAVSDVTLEPGAEFAYCQSGSGITFDMTVEDMHKKMAEYKPIVTIVQTSIAPADTIF